MPPKTPTLGSVLADARKAMRLSLREVADKVRKSDGSSISPQYLNDIEHDRRVPSPEVLEGLAKVLRVSRDYVHFLAGSMPAELKRLDVREKDVIEAYQLFRKKLGS